MSEDPRVQQYLGKHALVGITVLDEQGNEVEQFQVHGEIISIAEVLTLQVAGTTEVCTLPPDLDAFEPAPPGHYKLSSTGEVVVNPDLLATWTVRQPPPR